MSNDKKTSGAREWKGWEITDMVELDVGFFSVTTFVDKSELEAAQKRIEILEVYLRQMTTAVNLNKDVYLIASKCMSLADEALSQTSGEK